MLRRGGRIPAPGEGEAEAEVGVVVTRDRLHVLTEAVRRLGIPACVELRPGQCLTDAARAGLGFRGPFQQLSCRGGASPAQQVESPAVPRVAVASRGLLAAVDPRDVLVHIRGWLAVTGLGIFARTGIVAAVRCF